MILSKSNNLLLGFFICSFSFASAQDSLRIATSQQKAAVVVARMKQELSLSDRQVQLITPSIVERFELLKQYTTNKDVQLADANAVTIKKLVDVLTPQQIELYRQIREDTKKQKEEYLKSNPKYSIAQQEKEMDF